jgi:hypothetical protein
VGILFSQTAGWLASEGRCELAKSLHSEICRQARYYYIPHVYRTNPRNLLAVTAYRRRKTVNRFWTHDQFSTDEGLPISVRTYVQLLVTRTYVGATWVLSQRDPSQKFFWLPEALRRRDRIQARKVIE